MKRLALLLALTACGGSSPTAPTPPTMAGNWQVFLMFNGQERPSGTVLWSAITCNGGVTMVLANDAGTLNGGFTAGTLPCVIDGHNLAVPWASPIHGIQDHTFVSLTDGTCTYTGEQTDAHNATGSVDCNSDSGSTELVAQGHWTATK